MKMLSQREWLVQIHLALTSPWSKFKPDVIQLLSGVPKKKRQTGVVAHVLPEMADFNLILNRAETCLGRTKQAGNPECRDKKVFFQHRQVIRCRGNFPPGSKK